VVILETESEGAQTFFSTIKYTLLRFFFPLSIQLKAKSMEGGTILLRVRVRFH